MRATIRKAIVFVMLGALLGVLACASPQRRPDKEGVRDRAAESQRELDRETR